MDIKTQGIRQDIVYKPRTSNINLDAQSRIATINSKTPSNNYLSLEHDTFS